jgi:chromosomal replication initiation ATPase DnaA
MTEEFTKEEVRILKRICENPVFKESKPLPKNVGKTPQPLDHLKKIVCNFYNIKEEDLSGIRRDFHFVQARRDYCHLAFKKTKFSTTVIGNKIKRDHSSVLHHINKQPFNIDKIYNE